MLGVIDKEIRAIDPNASAVITAHANSPDPCCWDGDGACSSNNEVIEGPHGESRIPAGETAIRTGGVIIEHLRRGAEAVAAIGSR